MKDPKEIADSVLSGNGNALEAAVLLRRMKEACEEAYDRIKDAAYTEFKNFGEKELTVSGATVKEYPGRTTYDYSKCTDWQQLKVRLTACEKAHQLAAKAWLERGEQIVDEETGEIVKPAGAKSSPASIAISL